MIVFLRASSLEIKRKVNRAGIQGQLFPPGPGRRVVDQTCEAGLKLLSCKCRPLVVTPGGALGLCLLLVSGRSLQESSHFEVCVKCGRSEIMQGSNSACSSVLYQSDVKEVKCGVKEASLYRSDSFYVAGIYVTKCQRHAVVVHVVL